MKRLAYFSWVDNMPITVDGTWASIQSWVLYSALEIACPEAFVFADSCIFQFSVSMNDCSPEFRFVVQLVTKVITISVKRSSSLFISVDIELSSKLSRIYNKKFRADKKIEEG